MSCFVPEHIADPTALTGPACNQKLEKPRPLPWPEVNEMYKATSTPPKPAAPVVPSGQLIAPNTCLNEDKATVLAVWLAMGGKEDVLRTRYGYLKSPSDDVSEWYGVTVEGGRVIKLYWVLCELAGNIPAEIGGLSALTYLALARNDLTGERVRGEE